MAKKTDLKKKTVTKVAKKIVDRQNEATIEIIEQPDISKLPEIKEEESILTETEMDTKQYEILMSEAKLVLFPNTKTMLEEKLDEILIQLQQLNATDNTKLSKMSLTDLAALKETLNHEISSNRYPGGDSNIIMRGQNLILRINAEINNRIMLYN